jgi:hypothetical protein
VDELVNLSLGLAMDVSAALRGCPTMQDRRNRNSYVTWDTVVMASLAGRDEPPRADVDTGVDADTVHVTVPFLAAYRAMTSLMGCACACMFGLHKDTPGFDQHPHRRAFLVLLATLNKDHGAATRALFYAEVAVEPDAP